MVNVTLVMTRKQAMSSWVHLAEVGEHGCLVEHGVHQKLKK